jgi:hypothetical protein
MNLNELSEYESKLNNKDSLTIINLLRSLYTLLFNTTSDINNNWIQTKYVTNLLTSINNLEINDNTINDFK